jgi:hypothetical protein
MIKLTWLPEDLHSAWEDELENLVEDQTFLEQFFALTLLLESATRRLNAELKAS